jgi:hypothetical protein
MAETQKMRKQPPITANHLALAGPFLVKSFMISPNIPTEKPKKAINDMKNTDENHLSILPPIRLIQAQNTNN